MSQQEFLSKDRYRLVINSLWLTSIAALGCLAALLLISHPEWFASDEPEKPIASASTSSTYDNSAILANNTIEDGIDVASGFVADGDYMLVKTNCTACHSSQLVLQNRATREGWEEMIIWMQETQKLWDLGENQDKILDYLATHYAPEKEGRRRNLVVQEWYEIE